MLKMFDLQTKKKELLTKLLVGCKSRVIKYCQTLPPDRKEYGERLVSVLESPMGDALMSTMLGVMMAEKRDVKDLGVAMMSTLMDGLQESLGSQGEPR